MTEDIAKKSITAPDPSSARGARSFAQCRQAARSVRRAEHGKQVIGWLRPREIGGLSRQRPPLALLLYLLGRQNLLVWHSPEQFIALRPPDPRAGSGASTVVRWHWLIRWWGTVVPWILILVMLVTAVAMALAATLLPAGSALSGLLVPALILMYMTMLYPLTSLFALVVHGMWWLVRRIITRPVSRSVEATSLLLEQNWSMVLCHLTDPHRTGEFLRAVGHRASQLGIAGQQVSQPAGQQDFSSGWLVWDERCMTTSAARDAADVAPGVTRVPETSIRVLRLPVPASDDESAPRVEVPRPDAVRIVGLAVFFSAAWCAYIPQMVADVERAACEPRCEGRPASYGEALYWLLSQILRGEPGNLVAITTEARILGLTASVAGVGLLGLTGLALIRSLQERSKSVQDLRATVQNSLDASSRAALGSVFINYRQGLADLAVAGLRRELCTRLGTDKVFYDIRSIPPGTPYPDELRAKLEASTVLLAIIAQNWLTWLRKREHTLGPDWVRYEISTALRSGKTVIPVLLDDAALPSKTKLPADLAKLTLQQACPLRSTSFDEDLARLVGAVESALRIRN